MDCEPETWIPETWISKGLDGQYIRKRLARFTGKNKRPQIYTDAHRPLFGTDPFLGFGSAEINVNPWLAQHLILRCYG
jgi:hypothetical protein